MNTAIENHVLTSLSYLENLVWCDLAALNLWFLPSVEMTKRNNLSFRRSKATEKSHMPKCADLQSVQ